MPRELVIAPFCRLVAPDLCPAERVFAVRSASFDLARSRRELLGQLRANLGQLRTQCSLLTERRVARRQLVPLPKNARGQDLQARHGLTAREAEVALLLAEGRGNATIAAALGISPHTARHHTQHVLAKLGVHSRAEAGARLRV